MGFFVGSAKMEEQWLQPQIKMWELDIEALAHVALRCPHTAGVAFVFSFRAEW